MLSDIIGPIYGWVPEWPKGADCKSVSNAFGGSNPPPSILFFDQVGFSAWSFFCEEKCYISVTSILTLAFVYGKM